MSHSDIFPFHKKPCLEFGFKLVSIGVPSRQFSRFLVLLASSRLFNVLFLLDAVSQALVSISACLLMALFIYISYLYHVFIVGWQVSDPKLDE